MRITQDLMKKGISRDVIERCLEEEYTASQVDMIRFLMEKRHYHPSEATREEKAKMYRFLAQRGFPSGDINRALGECWEDSYNALYLEGRCLTEYTKKFKIYLLYLYAN